MFLKHYKRVFVRSALLLPLVCSPSFLLPRSAATETIVFAYPSPSASYLPLVVAQRKGFFDPENIQPELVQVRPAVAVPGLTIGSLDFTTALGSSIGARMRGAPLVIVQVFSDKPTDFLLGAKGIRTAKDLKGRVVGISALGTATHFLTLRVLKAVGLDPDKDVTIRAVGDEGLRLQALGSGLIQAALLGSQGVIQGEKEGLRMIVAAADVIEGLPFAGLATTLTKTKDNPQQLRRVLRAGLKGIRYVQENKAGTVDVIQSWLRIDREIASAAYDLAMKSYSRNGEVSDKGILLSMEFAKITGKIEKDISPGEVVDFRLLREVRKELSWP
ncbi:MAG: ABC transporter substrate-binding protein [Deltaproteobacteria bacterium]|nr:ABC transporter substrate-binding protein [Deltaproteobacteria bacterium]